MVSKISERRCILTHWLIVHYVASKTSKHIDKNQRGANNSTKPSLLRWLDACRCFGERIIPCTIPTKQKPSINQFVNHQLLAKESIQTCDSSFIHPSILCVLDLRSWLRVQGSAFSHRDKASPHVVSQPLRVIEEWSLKRSTVVIPGASSAGHSLEILWELPKAVAHSCMHWCM